MVKQSVGIIVIYCLFAMTTMAGADTADPDALHYWPQWRGPLANGVAPQANPPVEWSETKNVRWKILLAGTGHSTPIVWGDRIFLTAAIPYGQAVPPSRLRAPGTHDNHLSVQPHKFVVLAINRQDGKILWQKMVHKELPQEPGHLTSSLASNSPVTDGEHVFAFFGSRGLYCFDLDGGKKWQDDLGEMQTKHAHGEGSSPMLYGQTLIINWDHEGDSLVVAFDKRTGKERWKVARDELTSWATPIVVEHAGKPQVIISGTHRLRGYDLTNGSIIWECGGLSANIVASPVAGDGMVFAGSSYVKRALLAIKLKGAAGDITGTDRVAWSRIRGAPYVPSPLLYGDTLYTLRHYQGVLSRVNIMSGEDQGGPFRLQGVRNVYASPVGAAQRLYITDREGITLVIKHQKNHAPTVLGQNKLNDSFSASAALVGGDLILRGHKYLYCIAAE